MSVLLPRQPVQQETRLGKALAYSAADRRGALKY